MTDKSRTAHYYNDNQSLYIESFFSDSFDIQDLMKDYIIEERYRKYKVEDTTKQDYNTYSNETVVTSAKEENK